MIRNTIAALVVLAIGVTPAFAELVSPLPEVAATVARKDTYPVHEIPFAEGVRGYASIPYWAPLGFRPLTLDLYLPPKETLPANGYPLVIYIHGGGWMGGNSHGNGAFVDFPGVLARLAARGYAVASINYRLSGEARFPAQAQDVKASIRFLRLHAREYDIDPARAMTWGVSAGGYLAGVANVTCNVAELAPRQPPGGNNNPETRGDEIAKTDVSECVQGAVSWYGVFDMATIADQARSDGAMSRDVAYAPEWKLLGCFKEECSSEQIKLASPVSFVNRNTPPMLLIVGDADATVPYQQTMEMAAALKSVGAKHELIVMPGINHNLIGGTHEQTREATLKALDATLRFFDQTIGREAPPKIQ